MISDLNGWLTFWLSVDIADIVIVKARFEIMDLFSTVYSSNWLWYVFVFLKRCRRTLELDFPQLEITNWKKKIVTLDLALLTYLWSA